MGLEVTALRGHMAVLLSSALVWFYLILSGLPSLLFASLVLKQAVCPGVCPGGCVGEAVISTQECTVHRSVPSNRPGLLCGQQSPSSVLSEEQGTAADTQSTGRAQLINTASSVLSPAVA